MSTRWPDVQRDNAMLPPGRGDCSLLISMRTLGQRIRAAIEAAGMNPHQFAGKAGVAYSTVHRWLTDGGSPSAEGLQTIARITGQPVSFLLDTGGTAVTPPQHKAWTKFVEQHGSELEDWERTALASIHIEGREPTVATYQAVLMALRGSVQNPEK